MPKLVFDIETIGQFNELDEEAQEYILKYDEDDKKRTETKNKAGLWPFTGQIVALALLDPESKEGKVYFQAPDKKLESFSEDKVDFKICSEKEILENFWRHIKGCYQFVTFNGRRFDCPYIMLRSAVLKVRPTKNLMPPRYSDSIHIDLMDQLTFYDAFRKFSLDFYCRSFGIKSPKNEGMTGEKVNQAFQEGKHKEIARYCMADVKATAELYKRWAEYIKM